MWGVGGGWGEEWVPRQEAPAGTDIPHNPLATREFLPSLTWTFSNRWTIHRATRTISKDLKPLQGVHQWLQSQPTHHHMDTGHFCLDILEDKWSAHPVHHAGPVENPTSIALWAHMLLSSGNTHNLWEPSRKLLRAGLPPRALTCPSCVAVFLLMASSLFDCCIECCMKVRCHFCFLVF